jgi:DNA helicase II / ATP-dependent DNA helicase PcrA
MTIPGPESFARSVVISAGVPVPAPWDGAPRVVVGPADLADPGPVADVLHRAWLGRRPVVIELSADPEALRLPERHLGPVYELTPGFTFQRERLQFLVWANAYDARDGDPVWWHGRRAARRLAGDGVAEGGPADLTTADGSAWWVDGGPPDPPDPGDGRSVAHRWGAEAGRLVAAAPVRTDADLAPDQLAAVDHRTGPARVIAPAGSGKTRVLTERLRILVRRGTHPGVVTALAYNTRAADEMRSRAADVLGPDGPHVRTLNSLALWICTSFGSSGQLRVLDEPAVRDLVGELFEVKRQANADTTAPYLAALSLVRIGLVSPEAAEESYPDATGVADGFGRFRQVLAERGQVDFDEQIYRALEILLTDPDARAAAQARSRRMLVDEFQDLTPAHLLLIRLLVAPGFDCFGVGDDDQVIYGYAGATPEFLIDFSGYFPGAVDHPLEVNYRCPPAVVDAARHLLGYNRDRVTKVIRSPEGRIDPQPLPDGLLAGRGAVVVETAAADALTGLAVDVVDSWRADGVEPTDIAVLARVNAALLPVQVAFLESGVPCTTPLTTQVLGRTGIRAAFAYLRIGSDPGAIRREDVRDTIRRPSRGIAPMVADMVTKNRTTSVADIRRLAGRLSGRDVPKLLAYADDLEVVAQAAARSTADALRAVREGIGLDATLDTLDASRAAADRSTHADDLAALESIASFHPDAGTFAQWLREILSRPPADGPAIELSTVHRIKGKEWGHVLVVGASSGLFPHRLSEDLEGERRVFHVALTRAGSQVVVLADRAAPSPFLAELDGRAPHVTPLWRAVPGASNRKAQADRKKSSRGAGGARKEAARSGYGEQALRAWRSTVARADGVPAYVVLNDKELVGIAEAGPSTLAELANCRGMGPIRLDRWGDEILAVLEATRDLPVAP